jgi:hypothetical protein
MSLEKKYIDNPLNPRVKLQYMCNTYRFYVNNGMIAHDYEADENVIKEIDNIEEEPQKLRELYKNEDFFVVRGRGMYSRYWVKYYRKNNKNKPKIMENKKSYIIVYKEENV